MMSFLPSPTSLTSPIPSSSSLLFSPNKPSPLTPLLQQQQKQQQQQHQGSSQSNPSSSSSTSSPPISSPTPVRRNSILIELEKLRKQEQQQQQRNPPAPLTRGRSRSDILPTTSSSCWEQRRNSLEKVGMTSSAAPAAAGGLSSSLSYDDHDQHTSGGGGRMKREFIYEGNKNFWKSHVILDIYIKKHPLPPPTHSTTIPPSSSSSSPPASLTSSILSPCKPFKQPVHQCDGGGGDKEPEEENAILEIIAYDPHTGQESNHLYLSYLQILFEKDPLELQSYLEELKEKKMKMKKIFNYQKEKKGHLQEFAIEYCLRRIELISSTNNFLEIKITPISSDCMNKESKINGSNGELKTLIPMRPEGIMPTSLNREKITP